MNRTELEIETQDGWLLGATLYVPKGTPKLGVIINSATAVKQSYYGAFAAFLAEQGMLVVTYDYRGIGNSKVAEETDKVMTMQSWGALDFAAVIQWTTSQYPMLNWHCIGHSVGGQLIGLADNNTKLKSMYCVSAQSGYWKHWGYPHKLKMLMLWYVIAPVCCALFGRLPKWIMGGEDLPAGIARQWAHWGRHRDYIVDDSGMPIREGFEQLTCDMIFLHIDDDHGIAPRHAVEALRGFYKNARTQLNTIKATEFSTLGVGHFGFFRKQQEQGLWQQALNWLKEQPNSSPAGDEKDLLRQST